MQIEYKFSIWLDFSKCNYNVYWDASLVHKHGHIDIHKTIYSDLRILKLC
jgi:hypothetical protein